MLLRLRIEKVVHHRDDDGHALRWIRDATKSDNSACKSHGAIRMAPYGRTCLWQKPKFHLFPKKTS
jgi:hypothetical protein